MPDSESRSDLLSLRFLLPVVRRRLCPKLWRALGPRQLRSSIPFSSSWAVSREILVGFFWLHPVELGRRS